MDFSRKEKNAVIVYVKYDYWFLDSDRLKKKSWSQEEGWFAPWLLLMTEK